MRLERIAHERFRNLLDGEVRLAPATTVLLGDNGQGKTSVLEAIGVLATTRSFRRARVSDLCRHGEQGFLVKGLVRSQDDVGIELSYGTDGARRATCVSRVDVELAEYVAHLSVVAVTQSHAGVVRGGPSERRDFLDRGLLGMRPAYIRALAAHRRSLRQKNALLKRAESKGTVPRAELAAWNEQLADDAAEIVVRRREYVAGLSAVLSEVALRYLPPTEGLVIELQDVLTRRAELAEDLSEGRTVPRASVREALLERMLELGPRELAAGQALVGPHRDELLIRLNGRDLRRFASSGQQRNALLALKMAKVELFRVERGESPLLLVDDVDTEIDPRRLETFLDHVGGRAQAVITSSKSGLFGSPGEDGARYRVSEGLLTPA